jgi:poly(hydroxyalkanoate) depolymerase family esterase
MNDMLNSNKMVEAMRLTRSGRLTEATALIQRLLRGEISPDKIVDPPDIAHSSSGREPPTIDAKAETVEETDRAPSTRIGFHKRPAGTMFGAANAQPHNLPGLRALLDRVKLPLRPGLLGLVQPVPVSTPDIVPEGGKFIEATYSNPAGSRAYKLYIPSGYHGQALPLLVMLHGCTQSPDDFAAGTRMNLIAEEQSCLVVYPAQSSDANPAKCWNWFRPTDQRRGQGEPSLIAGITRQVMRDYSVDPQRVYVAGLSAGAAAAAVVGTTYPDLYAAIGVHSGLACGAAHDLASAFVAMKQGDAPSSSEASALSRANGSAVPTIVFHGDCDTTVHPRNGYHVIAQSKRTTSSRKLHRGRAPGGQTYTRTVHTEVTGRTIFEHWEIHGAGHAWSGGNPAYSHTDPRGPDATREMLRFFLEHPMSSAPQ